MAYGTRIFKTVRVLRRFPEVVDYTAGSNMIPITFRIEDWEIPAGATAQLFLRKRSGQVVYNSCTVDGTENSVTVQPTVQMFIEGGRQPGQIQIISGGKVLNSFPVEFDVQEQVATSEAVESTNEFTAFMAAMANAESLTYSVVDDYVQEHGITTGATPAQAAQIEENASDISSLEERVAELEEDIEQAEANRLAIAALTERVAVLEEAAAGIASNAERIAAVEADIAEIKAGISGGDFTTNE